MSLAMSSLKCSKATASNCYNQSLAKTVAYERSCVYQGINLRNCLPGSAKAACNVNHFKHL